MPMSLPSGLQVKLDALAARCQRQRLARGILRVVLTGLGSAAVIMAADAFFSLPVAVRVGLAAAWLFGLGVGIWRWLIVPRRRPLDSTVLAAAVEAEFPRLDERLTTSVELSGREGDFSPALLALLLQETENRTTTIDFRRAAIAAPSRRSLAALTAVIALGAVAMAIWPDVVSGVGRRFVMPWDRAPAVATFALTVEPGDVVVARGRPVNIQAELLAIRDGAVPPQSVTLVRLPRDGPSDRRRMPVAQRAGRFSLSLDGPVEDFRYCVESGDLRSSEYSVRVVAPIELGTTGTMAIPPEYARSAVSPVTRESLNNLEIVQHGRVRWTCRFDRRPVAAAVIWRDIASQAETRLPMALADDGLTGAAELRVAASGTYRLVAEAEHGIATSTPDYTVAAIVDRPPEFRRVVGFGESLREVGINDVLPLQLVVGDDIAVTSAEWELRINDAPAVVLPLPLAGLGRKEASGSIPLRLSDKVQVGDRVACRLRIADNREVPEAGLKPQSATFPPGDQWCEWVVTSQSGAISERQAESQRDAIDDAIRELVERLAREGAALTKVGEQEAAANDRTRIRDALRQIGADILKLGEKCDRGGAASLGDEARSIAQREMQAADDHLRDALAGEADSAAATRRAERSVADARERLERLRAANEALARQRQDAAEVEKLAGQQEKLADQTKAPDAAGKLDQLKQSQRGLTDHVNKIARQNEAARDALQAASAEQSRILADKAKALAESQRELDRAIRDLERTQNAAKLAEAARTQKEISEQIEQLTKPTATGKGAPPAAPSDAARQAADALRRGEIDDAAALQKQTAEALDRLAEQLQAAIDAVRDPREAAKQLSRLQAETRRRTLDSSRPNAPERETILRDEQVLQRAMEKLAVPENTPARREQIEASMKARQAITALQNGHHNTAADLMNQAKEALDRLVEALPSAGDRQKAARTELLKIRKDQLEVSDQAKSAASRPPKADNAAALAQQQADLAERIGRLDTPQAEELRDSARRAAAAALDDLAAGRWSDVAASQRQLDRELKNLDAALAQRATDTQKALALARRQRDIANEADRAGGDSGKLGGLTPWQEQLENDVRTMPSTAAPVGQSIAKSAVADALSALRDRPDDAQTAALIRKAADRLSEWAAQLGAMGTNADRAQRLARQFESQKGALKTDADARQRMLPQFADELQQIRAGDQAANEKKAAQDALTATQQNPGGANSHLDVAHDALQRLAARLAAPAEAPASAADLAERQRSLARETGAVPKNYGSARTEALEKLAKRQRELRDQSKQSPSDNSPQAMQAARQAMAQAEQALARQETSAAQAAQLRAAQALDRVARDGGAKPQEAGPPPGTPTAEQVEQARDLARKQRELAKQAAEQTATTKAPPNANAQQGAMAQEAGDLAGALQEDVSPPAANAAREAEAAMREAQQRQETDAAGARKARARAAEALDRAAEAARRESEQRGGSPNAPSSPAGRSLMQARSRMRAAQQQLGSGQTEPAAQQMQDAAAALRQAAEGLRGDGLAPPGRDGKPARADATKPPISEELARELQRHPGKKWGELPGELRTRILEDVKMQYGDDYARIIRLYFESLADRK